MGNIFSISQQRQQVILMILGLLLGAFSSAVLPLGGLGIVTLLSFLGGFVIWIGLAAQSLSPSYIPWFNFLGCFFVASAPNCLIRLTMHSIGSSTLEDLCRSNAARVFPTLKNLLLYTEDTSLSLLHTLTSPFVWQ
jgi:hypothetical protein